MSKNCEDKGKRGLDASQRQALELFAKAKEAKKKGGAVGIDIQPMRVRLAEHIDLSKASPSCKRCYGTGVTGNKVVGEQRIPIICRCVVRGGGVKKDQLDRMQEGKGIERRAQGPATDDQSGPALIHRSKPRVTH